MRKDNINDVRIMAFAGIIFMLSVMVASGLYLTGHELFVLTCIKVLKIMGIMGLGYMFITTKRTNYLLGIFILLTFPYVINLMNTFK